VAAAAIEGGIVLRDGSFNTAGIAVAIRSACSRLDGRLTDVMLGMTGCEFVARVMELPPVPDSEVRAVLRGEMDHYRILPTGQSAFDFYQLPQAPPREGQPEEAPARRVLMMAAEENLVSGFRQAVDQAGLNTIAAEPGSVAVLRALYPLIRHETAVATVAISNTGTDIFITHAGELQFYRRVDTGISDLVRDAAAAQGVSSSRQLFAADEEDEESTPDDGGEITPSANDPIQRTAVSMLMTEVQRSLDYFSREYPSLVDRMLVRFAIDSSHRDELFPVMQQYLRTECELATPLKTISATAEVTSQLSDHEASRYVVAVGLAVRGAGGEYHGAPSLDLSVGDHVMQERRAAPRSLMVSAAVAAFILLGTLGAATVVGRRISDADRKLTQAKAELKGVTDEHTALVNRLDRQRNLIGIIQRRDRPLRETIEFLGGAIGNRASLLNLNVDEKGGISLSGFAVSPKVVADIMDTINMSPALEPIRLNSIARDDRPENGGSLRFELQTAFTKPKQTDQTVTAAHSAPAGASR
jgi:Tfp pilus assembly PilM family ATPase